MPEFRITAVCLGNICRSPMAEAVLAAHVHDAGLAGLVAVDSAGTGGWHIGEEPDRRALATLRAAGYPLDHRGRQYEGAWFEPGHPARADLVVTMDADNLAKVRALAPDDVARARVRPLRSFDPAFHGVHDNDPRLVIPDPYYGGQDEFDDVLSMIESASAGLIARLPDLMS